MHLRLTAQLQNSVCFHPAPFLTPPGLAGSLIHIRPPFINPGSPSPTQPSIHTNTPIHSLTHSLTSIQAAHPHSHGLLQSDTCFLTYTASFLSRPPHPQPTPACSWASFPDAQTLTHPWLLGLNTREASAPQPGHECMGRRPFSFSYCCQSVISGGNEVSFLHQAASFL